MSRFVHSVQALALAMGAPGILIASFLDSSILSLPEIADLLVVWMVASRKTLAFVYIACAVAGSLLGCLLLYYLGRKGGEALVRRQFSSERVERTLAAFRRHGVMAVLIPSILPPPAPFKIFVLMAGVAEISVTRFSMAIFIGRSARYLVEGLLAIRYGDQALSFIHDHGTPVALAAAGLLVAGFLVYLRWTRP